MLYDIRTKFREDRYRHLSNIIVSPQKFESRNDGITDGRDLWTMSLSLGSDAMVHIQNFI
jgi:hypothetical protein